MTDTQKLHQLNRVLLHCRKSPFYSSRIPEQPLQSLEDFKKLPLTTKEELRAQSPFGLLCVPKTKLYQYHETFGTTGVPASTWMTRKDLYDHAERVNESGIHFNKEDIVLIRFPYAISTIAHFTHVAAQEKKACVVPASSRTTITPYTRVVKLLKKLEVTVLACLPLQAILIAETAELMGLNPKKDFPALRLIMTAGEPMTDSRRNLLESIWGVPVSDNYGMTEIGPAITNCEYGCPHPLDDYHYFEILDENLQREVAPGEIGYLVVTTLSREATPLIRYFTGDRAKKVQVDCPCGKKWAIEIHGRKENVITVNDRELDIWDFEEIISHLPCRRFWVVAPAPGGLQFVVEEEKPGDAVHNQLIKQLESQYQIKLNIRIVPKGTIYDREELLSIGEVGKPRYIFTEEEMVKKAYTKGIKKG